MVQQPAQAAFSAKRERLLQAAAHCFNQKGYSGTSLKDVADRLGLTDAALYYYVRNKEELVYLCYLRAADVGSDAMDRAEVGHGNGFERVLCYLDWHVEAMVGDKGPIAIMSEIPSLSAEHRQEILKLSRRHSRRFEKLLEAGIADGSIVDCDVRMTGNAIMGALNWIPKWFHGDASAAARTRREIPATLARSLRPDG